MLCRGLKRIFINFRKRSRKDNLFCVTSVMLFLLKEECQVLVVNKPVVAEKTQCGREKTGTLPSNSILHIPMPPVTTTTSKLVGAHRW